jgi:Flp pilus assembly protein TadB
LVSLFGFVAALLGVVGSIMGRTAVGKRNRERRKRKKTEEANERWREERNRRSDDLREAWRRNHPSEQKKFGKGRPKKRPPA